jgi:putative FmdB family regulatory protein
MPIYEYACGECEREFELLVRSNERPVCPQCGGVKLERLLSVPAAHSGVRSQDVPACQGGKVPM